MRQRGIIIALFVVSLVISLALISVAENDSNDKVDKKVFDKIDNNQEAEVFVKFKENNGQNEMVSEKILSDAKSELDKSQINADFGELISANIDSNDLMDLEKNPDVERVSLVGFKYPILQNSVSIINASLTDQVVLNGVNLTGVGQTVCVIDTGVNYSHPDLGGCYGGNNPSSSCKVVGGHNFANSNNDPMDNDGHGTHVAGIIAANGTIKGVAPGAKIVALKVCDPSCSDADIISAIYWCVGNSSVFNISVISMSLGGAINYTSYCDGDVRENSDLFADPINAAVARNISVVVANGNSYNYSAVASPACIGNATRVGSSTKVEAVSGFSNRWALSMLLAPGSSINSTSTSPNNHGCSGFYCDMSGTSMATPHVSAAIAILNQFLSGYGMVKTPVQLETSLNNSGNLIYDSSANKNYSRINVYNTLLSLDIFSPSVSLSSPANSSVLSNVNQTFRCSSSDITFRNVSFYLWNSTSEYNHTYQTSSSSSFEVNVTNMAFGNYTWNCLFTDLSNNSAIASANYTLKLVQMNVNLSLPLSNLKTRSNQSFVCNFTSANSMKNTTFYIWNSSGVEFRNSVNVTGIVNSSLNWYNFTHEDSYSWNCFLTDIVGNSIFANSNSTIVYDLTAPNISLLSPTAGYSATGAQTISFDFNVSDSLNVSNCSLIIDNVSVANNTLVSLGNNSISYSVSVGNYIWGINCTDEIGNQANSSLRTLTIAASSSSSSGGGSSGGGSSSGGGGGTIGTTYSLTEIQAESGFSKSLVDNDKIKFEFNGNGNKEQHVIITNKVYPDRVDINISSNPINIILLVGESKKVSLIEGFYNLYVKLNEISNGKANLTIKTINEPIELKKDKSNDSKVKGNHEIVAVETPPIQESSGYEPDVLGIVMFVVLAIIIIIIVMLFRTEKPKHIIKVKKKLNKKGEFEGEFETSFD